MSAHTHTSTDAAHRTRVLHALGLTPWVRRVPAVCAETGTDVAPSSELMACVVILPDACSARELDLLGRALSACGATLARAARVTLSNGELAGGVPLARTYLVLGEAQAHALGRALPAAAIQQAQIVLADEPAVLLTRADAKRRLWSALRTLRRALAGSAG